MFLKFLKSFFFIILLFLLISGIFTLFNSQKLSEKEISFSQFIKEIKEEKIQKLEVSQAEILVIYKDKKQQDVLVRKEPGVSFFEILKNYGLKEENLKTIDLKIKKEKESIFIWLIPLLSLILPLLFLGWIFWGIFQQAKSGPGQIFSFLKAPSKLFDTQRKEGKITFKDIAGLEEAKEEIREIVDFLKNPKKYLQMGAKIPRGVLLVGAPGTGKTMLAKAVANESNVSFFSISGSEFIELFVGVGASRVRNLFDQARKTGKAIIFIDEIDSIGKIRGVGVTGGHEEREQTLNQILAEMDGIGREENLIIMGATNRPEYLDPALLRPGRFDRRIVLDLPDVKNREDILRIHCREKPLSLDINLKEVAERTPGFSGADLANVVNEAAILAARRNKQQIFQAEFLEAIEKVLLGPERKSHILSKEEKEVIAYHEVGHALVSSFLSKAEPVRKISIVSRGLFMAGYTIKAPTKEKGIKSKSELLAEMAGLLGGYCAEKIKFREITTGAANDLERATQLARKLVKEWGMSSLGPVVFGEREGAFFLGREFEEYKNYSEETATQIDKAISGFIKDVEKTAWKILVKKKTLLEKIAKILIEKETIEKEEFEKLIGKKEEVSRLLPKKEKSIKEK